MGAILGVVSVPVMFVAGGVAWNAFRSGEGRMAMQSGVVFLFGLIVFVSAPKAAFVHNIGLDVECIRYSSFAESC